MIGVLIAESDRNLRPEQERARNKISSLTSLTSLSTFFVTILPFFSFPFLLFFRVALLVGSWSSKSVLTYLSPCFVFVVS